MADSPGLFVLPSSFTRTVTIDHNQVPSTQTDFPVLFNFTDTTFKTIPNGGHIINSKAFTFSSDSAGANLLKWEIERYNATTGEIVAWVKVSSVSSVSDTVFYLKYGGGISTDQSDPINVWSNNFISVFHLKDGTTLSVADSVNLHNGTNHGATATTGQIDGASAFASVSSQYVDIGANWTGPTDITISCWTNATSLPNPYNATAVGRRNGAGLWLILVKSTGKLAMFVQATGAPSYDGTGSHTLLTGTTYFLTLTYDSSAGLIGYVNASSDGTSAASGALVITAGATTDDIGHDPGVGRFWDGMIDEVRISSVARSANWITCEYNNQKTSSTFVTLGNET